MVHCGPHGENQKVSASAHPAGSERPLSHVMALIAMECESPGVPPRVSLDREMVGVLADALAHDLARHIPEIRSLDFVFVGALYDQAQLLRHGWPLHAALADALDHLPRNPPGTGHVVALGAHNGRLPTAVLEPDSSLLGSPMVVLPWVLSGPPERIGEVGSRLEREMLEKGLIGAELALALGEAFGVKTAHARHLTTLDLCALACAQYEHAGIGGLWQMIETALLDPDQARSVTLDDGSTLRYLDGAVHGSAPDRRRLAQFRAILGAHGLSLVESTESP